MAMKPEEIIQALRELEVPHDEIGAVLGRDRTAATKMLKGVRSIKANELEALSALVVRARSARRQTEGAEEQNRDTIHVPEVDARLSAGPGALNEVVDQVASWEFSRRYLVDELKVNPATVAVVEVHGDSMEPTLRSGDRVLVDHSDRNPAKPGIYAIWDSHATVVKRIEKVPTSDPPQVVLISDNKNHHEYTVLQDLVHVIGRVVWVARRL